jgi:hypothetical protein
LNGPVTDEGKAASSQNAVKHGLLSRHVSLPTEDPDEFIQFAEGFREDHIPVGETESFLVERIIRLAWRHRRAGLLETEILGAQTGGVAALRDLAKSKRSLDNRDKTN